MNSAPLRLVGAGSESPGLVPSESCWEPAALAIEVDDM